MYVVDWTKVLYSFVLFFHQDQRIISAQREEIAKLEKILSELRLSADKALKVNSFTKNMNLLIKMKIKYCLYYQQCIFFYYLLTLIKYIHVLDICILWEIHVHHMVKFFKIFKKLKRHYQLTSWNWLI